MLILEKLSRFVLLIPATIAFRVSRKRNIAISQQTLYKYMPSWEGKVTHNLKKTSKKFAKAQKRAMKTTGVFIALWKGLFGLGL